MKKRWIFPILTVVLLTVIFFTPFSSWMGYWSSRALLYVYWGQDLQYKDLYWSDGELVIMEPTLNSPSKIIADRLTITPKLGLHYPGFIVNVSLNHTSLASLVDLMQNYDPQFNDWEIFAGEVTGDIELNIPSQGSPIANGMLHISKASINNFPAEISGMFSAVDMTIDAQKMVFCLSEGATINGYHNEEPQWQLNDMRGTLALSNDRALQLDLETSAACSNRELLFNLKGNIKIKEEQPEKLNLTLSCLSAELPTSLIAMTMDDKIMHLDCQHMSATEGKFLQSVLRTYWPGIDQLEWESGFVKSSLEVSMGYQGISAVKIKAFSGTFLRIKSDLLNLSAHFPAVHGFGQIDLSAEDPFDTLNGEIQIEEASLDLHRGLPPISNIGTLLKLKKGHIEDSSIKLGFAHLRGTLNFTHPATSLTMEGKVNELISFFPEKFRSILNETFGAYQIGINASLEKNEIKGTVHLGQDLIHFASDLSLDPKGWFYAQQLPLEKYVSPFLFPTKVAQMSGVGEFQGIFDSDAISIRYDVDHLIIENEHLKMERPSMMPSKQRELLGYHHLNLHDGSIYGCMPIKNASYYEKHHDLEFSGISSEAIFEEGIIHFKNLECYCEGIFFSGNLDFDYHDPAPGIFSVEADISQFQATVAQAQRFFSHLHKPGLLEKLPLEGELSARAKGAQLRIDFSPADDLIHTTVQAVLNHGEAHFPSLRTSFKDLSMNMDYDHNSNDLSCHDLQGIGLIGSGEYAKEYFMEDSHIHFENLKNQEFSLDLILKEEREEIARLVGRTRAIPGDEKIAFNIDPIQTHLGNIHPSKLEFALSSSGELLDWAFAFQFPMTPFLDYLKEFERSGWFFLSKRVLQQGAYLNLGGGLFDLKLGYHEGVFDYELAGNNISFHNALFNKLIFKGTKQDRRWIVDQLSIDKLELSAEIWPKDDLWKIQFLGLKYGHNLLMGLEGTWNPTSNKLLADINLLEWNLEKDELLRHWIPAVQPMGSLNGVGTATIEFISQAPWIRYNASISSKMQGWQWGKLSLYHETPFTLQLDSEKGIAIKEAKIALWEGEHLLGTTCCQSFQHNKCAWHIQNMVFKIPKASRVLIVDELQKEFPDFIEEGIKEKILAIRADDWSGCLNYNKDKDSFRAELQLSDGIYNVKNTELMLQGPRIQWEPSSLSLSAQSTYGRYPYYIQSHFNWPKMNGGDCLITDLSLSNNRGPLHIEWQSDNGDLRIQSISGSCAGITCALKSGLAGLEGNVDVDIDRACLLLDPEMTEMVQRLQLGPRYNLEGQWQIHESDKLKIQDSLYFTGKLKSQSTTFKGYEFDKLEADLEISPQQIKLQNASVRDIAGTFQCPEMIFSLNREGEAWHVWAPQLIFKEVRPFLLKEIGNIDRKPRRASSLLVKRIEVNNFSGQLSKVSEWQGSGILHFCNPTRRHLQHPLLMIPSELILRLGLDLQVLNPVTGYIYFDLREGRFYLTKFKDMYSEGRGSKFFLDPQAPLSWVDLEGQLSIHVRMKQYNLIFKLAELFSVSIQGNVKKPRYSLERIQK